MTQITSGIRSVLSSPGVYDFLQVMLGGINARKRVCEDYLTLSVGDNIVDIGCGTATTLKFLPEHINYYGFDLSPEYIESAKRNYGHLGTFHCKYVTLLEADEMPSCRYALAMGVLHHLDDEGSRRLIDSVYDRLAPGGSMIMLDPVYEPGQSRIAYELIRRDRGQNVRTREGYLGLVSPRYSRTSIEIHHDYLHVPYTLGVMQAVKA